MNTTSTKPPLIFLIFATPMSGAASFQNAVAPLIENHCIDCHDADAQTSLNFESLNSNLNDRPTFVAWKKVFDRVSNGEMPPAKKMRPPEELLISSLPALRTELHNTNAARQKQFGRVAGRRLTRTEYEYTMHDLLGIHGGLAKLLPAEDNATGFDTIATEVVPTTEPGRRYLSDSAYWLYVAGAAVERTRGKAETRPRGTHS